MGSYMRLDLRIVKLYTAQMVHTLEYLQQNEIMHRDLKPQNLMLDHRWNMKFVSTLSPLVPYSNPILFLFLDVSN